MSLGGTYLRGTLFEQATCSKVGCGWVGHVACWLIVYLPFLSPFQFRNCTLKKLEIFGNYIFLSRKNSLFSQFPFLWHHWYIKKDVSCFLSEFLVQRE